MVGLAVTFCFVLGPAVLAPAPAAASHACYVQMFDHIWWNYYTPGNQGVFWCPSPGTGWSQWVLGDYGLGSNVSSMSIHLGAGQSMYVVDGAGNVFGGPNGLRGPGTWDLADLRPYGWNDKAVRVITHV